jgi:rRNA maturation endonuclease Nob1
MNTNELILRPEKEGPAGLAEAIAIILDKGLVINADITVSVVGVELLGIKIRAALASFETAAKYGLEFPSGTNLNAPAWRRIAAKESCPSCGKLFENILQKNECLSCGWKEQENWK